MASAKYIKVALFAGWTLFILIWLASGSLSKVIGTNEPDQPDAATVEALPTPDPALYAGSETCKACHEDQFNSVSATKHGKLANISSWKDKVQGCESCHGPGKAHSEDPSLKNIISFKNKNSKEISETCLACHSGKEAHNNFRRGEHWRNNVGCTDCHTPHGPDHGNIEQGSMTLIGEASRQKPTEATQYMLKDNEQQLCISCHSETKSQFSKPFHHKVLEGTMKCSDCHNPHGGFESKQTRLAVGNDVTCIKCHTDKQGPFVFEHAPLKVEGCTACHTPHGAANSKLLKRTQVRQLCMECHSAIFEQLAPDTPSFHNQAQVKYQNCTTCHAAIHGSNTNKDFFR